MRRKIENSLAVPTVSPFFYLSHYMQYTHAFGANRFLSEYHCHRLRFYQDIVTMYHRVRPFNINHINGVANAKKLLIILLPLQCIFFDMKSSLGIWNWGAVGVFQRKIICRNQVFFQQFIHQHNSMVFIRREKTISAVLSTAFSSEFRNVDQHTCVYFVMFFFSFHLFYIFNMQKRM